MTKTKMKLEGREHKQQQRYIQHLKRETKLEEGINHTGGNNENKQLNMDYMTTRCLVLVVRTVFSVFPSSTCSNLQHNSLYLPYRSLSKNKLVNHLLQMCRTQGPWVKTGLL